MRVCQTQMAARVYALAKQKARPQYMYSLCKRHQKHTRDTPHHAYLKVLHFNHFYNIIF